MIYSPDSPSDRRLPIFSGCLPEGLERIVAIATEEIGADVGNIIPASECDQSR